MYQSVSTDHKNSYDVDFADYLTEGDKATVLKIVMRDTWPADLNGLVAEAIREVDKTLDRNTSYGSTDIATRIVLMVSAIVEKIQPHGKPKHLWELTLDRIITTAYKPVELRSQMLTTM